MTHDEIIRAFRRFKYDPEFRSPNDSVPISLLCDFAGISRKTLYAILRKEIPLSYNCNLRLTAAIKAVAGGLRWRRRRQVWHMVNPEKFSKLPRYEGRTAA